MKHRFLMLVSAFLLVSFIACDKDDNDSSQKMTYYEVGIDRSHYEWRDSSFIVATNNPDLIIEINAQLSLPVSERKMLSGALAAGNGGYNKNASHEFKWHFKEDDWHFTDATIEIGDGRPYSDLDINTGYWIDTVQRFSPWSSYIKRKVN